MLKTGSSGGIYIHPWDITDEGIEDCFDFLGDTCGLNELFIAAAYHTNTFLLPHNPKRLLRWDEGSVFFTPQHARWSQTRIRPVVGECMDTSGYLANIVDAARQRDWGVIFFVVFHFSHSTARAYPEACCVDAMGERQRAELCPANPEVRTYDLALVEELMTTYGGDGIRYESLGYGGWNSGFVVDKVEVKPCPRDQFLLKLCFCGHCLERDRRAGNDPLSLRRAVRDHLFDNLDCNPNEWDQSPVDEEWARSAFEGRLWPYLETRCDTVTSLYEEVQQVTQAHGGVFMPFGPDQHRDVLGGLDYGPFYPHLKRVSFGIRGTTLDEQYQNLVADLAQAPSWAEPEIMHNQRAFPSMEALREQVLMVRQAGIRHHSFHYYGMSRTYQLEWIGSARQAWA